MFKVPPLCLFLLITTNSLYFHPTAAQSFSFFLPSSHLLVSSDTNTLYLFNPPIPYSSNATASSQVNILMLQLDDDRGIDASSESQEYAGFSHEPFSNLVGGAYHENSDGYNTVVFSPVVADGRILILAGKGNCTTGGRIDVWELKHDNKNELVKVSMDLEMYLTYDRGIIVSETNREVFSLAETRCQGNEAKGNETNGALVSSGITMSSLSLDMILGVQDLAISFPPSTQNVPQELPPGIPATGFTITQLPPINSTGSIENVRSERWVIIGGQQPTSRDMNKLAVFSSSDQSWSFITVSNSSAQFKARSGHAAVLSRDGKRIMVVGGWESDVGNGEGSSLGGITIAQPGIAVLDISNDEWVWKEVGGQGGGGGGRGGGREEEKGTGNFPSSQETKNVPMGIFGHSVHLLDEEVVMFTGGYIFVPSSASPFSTISSRGILNSSDIRPNTKTYLYNLTSSSYITKWKPKPTSNTSSPTSSASAIPSTTEINHDPRIDGRDGLPSGHQHLRRIAIVAGTVTGFFVVLGAASCGLWWSRRVVAERLQSKDNEARMDIFSRGRHSLKISRSHAGVNSDWGRVSGGPVGYDSLATVNTTANSPWRGQDKSPFSFEEGVEDVLSLKSASPVYQPQAAKIGKVYQHPHRPLIIYGKRVRSISPIIEGEEEDGDGYGYHDGDESESSDDDNVDGEKVGLVLTSGDIATGRIGQGGLQDSNGRFKGSINRFGSVTNNLTCGQVNYQHPEWYGDEHVDNMAGYQVLETSQKGIKVDQGVQEERDEKEEDSDTASDWGQLIRRYWRHVEFVRGLSVERDFLGNVDTTSTNRNSTAGENIGHKDKPLARTPPSRSSSTSLTTRIRTLIRPIATSIIAPVPTSPPATSNIGTKSNSVTKTPSPPIFSTTLISAAVAPTPSPPPTSVPTPISSVCTGNGFRSRNNLRHSSSWFRVNNLPTLSSNSVNPGYQQIGQTSPRSRQRFEGEVPSPSSIYSMGTSDFSVLSSSASSTNNPSTSDTELISKSSYSTSTVVLPSPRSMATITSSYGAQSQKSSRNQGQRSDPHHFRRPISGENLRAASITSTSSSATSSTGREMETGLLSEATGDASTLVTWERVSMMRSVGGQWMAREGAEARMGFRVGERGEEAWERRGRLRVVNE